MEKQFIEINFDYNTSSHTKKKYRRFFDRHSKRTFVKWCAYKGMLDNSFDKHSIKIARNKGVLPKGYNIHHIIPVSGAGEDNEKVNDFENLVIISDKLHQYINKHYYEPQIAHGVENIHLPYLPQIATSENLYNKIRYQTEGILPSQHNRPIIKPYKDKSR